MDEHDLLRHFLATLNYRLRGALRDAPRSFFTYLPPGDGWTAAEVLHHINDLMRSVVRKFDRSSFLPMPVNEAEKEAETFGLLLPMIDAFLVKRAQPVGDVAGKPVTLALLLQGPLSDAMTHVGQIAQLRRQAGSPVEPQNFMKADIQPGVFPE